MTDVLDLDIVQEAGQVIIRCSGDLDLAAKAPIHAALDLVDLPQGCVLTVDLAGVPFCDSAGLVVLVEMADLATEHGASLRLINPTIQVRRLLAITGLDGVLDVPP
jgi:anti-anti-sigma factor